MKRNDRPARQSGVGPALPRYIYKRQHYGRSRVIGALVLFIVVAGLVVICKPGRTQNTPTPAKPSNDTKAVISSGTTSSVCNSPSPVVHPATAVKATAPARIKDKGATWSHTHILHQGQTLASLARENGVSLRALLRENGIHTQRQIRQVRPGRKLRIPNLVCVAAKTKTRVAQKHSSAGNGNVDNMISTALSYRGVRYRYGGMTSRGFDCSGFVAKVLQGQGMDMPHNAAALFGHGIPVAKENLRTGDLVFFHTTRRSISHVGIYLGEGNFIHASSGRGRVRTDTLLSGYYARRYVGARRIMQ
jgi:cell wall-associated NlpC family hydrolase